MRKTNVNARVILPIIAAFIVLILIVLTCIFAANANSARNEYTQARDSVGEDLYTSLKMFTRSYDGVTLAGADVQGGILPSMWDYYTAATALTMPSPTPMASATSCLTPPRAKLLRRPSRPLTMPLPKATRPQKLCAT